MYLYFLALGIHFSIRWIRHSCTSAWKWIPTNAKKYTFEEFASQLSASGMKEKLHLNQIDYINGVATRG
jgi:hypothetical protein